MKSLAERKQFRAEQRKLQQGEDKGTDVSAEDIGNNGGAADSLDTMTIADLKAYVVSLGGEVPSNISKRDDVLAYAKNLRTAKAQETNGASQGNGAGSGGTGTTGAWSANN